MNELPLTPRAKRVLASANRFAETNKHCYIGTEHVLLGLLAETDGLVPHISEACGLDPKDLNDKATKAVKDAWGTTPQKPDLKAVAETLRSLADLIG